MSVLDDVGAGTVSREGAVAAAVAAATTDASTGTTGLVLAGGAGLGKSFVLARAAEALSALGHPVVALQGEPALSPIPFGAFRPVLNTGDDDRRGWAEAVRAAIDELSAPPGAPATVVVVDELQHLDTGSAAILHQGLAARRFRLVGSLRSGEAVPEGVARLWADGLVRREDLRPLDRPSTDALAAALVGGPLEGASEQRLWAWTQGNPLFLRELIASARASGSLQQVRGLWRVRGEVAGSEGLRALLGHRLATCSPAVREVVEVLAVADRLAASVLEAMAGVDAVAEAEQAGVIVVHDDAGLECRLAHPLHGEVLRHELGLAQIRVRQDALLDTLDRLGLTEAADPLLLAVWHLDTERSAPETAGLLTRGATSAWMANDSPLAARLARRAWELGGDAATGLLLCEALLRLGEGREMASVAEALLAQAATDGVRAAAVSYLATGMRIWENRPDDAIALAQSCAADIADPHERQTLDLLVAGVELDVGRPDRAAEIARTVFAAASPGTASAATMILVPALAAMGDLDESIAAADQAIARAFGAEGQTLNDLGAHLLFRTEAAALQGSLDDAVGLLEPSYEAVAASGDVLARAWLTFVLGRTEIRRGRARSALAWFEEASAAFADLHRPGWEAWAHGGAAQALAYLGEAVEARRAADRVNALGPWRIPFGDPDVQRSVAWVAVVEGDLPRAHAELRAAHAQAERQLERVSAAAVLNDLTRLGAADTATPLRAAAGRIPSRLVAAWADRAEAMRDGDRAGLARSAALLAGEGASLDAAEAEAVAAVIARQGGDERSAAAAVQRAAALLERCEGASNPTVATVDRPQLSRRELDVARLAATGLSRRDIARDLYLSVRTVDSHLQRIFRKLGVSSSAGLADALADAQ